MICSDIWHKYHEWYFEIVVHNFRQVKFETILKYHEWYLCQISHTNHAIISCLYYYTKRFIIFTRRYFKLSWNTTALSQSNCRNFSCSSINRLKGRNNMCRHLNFNSFNSMTWGWIGTSAASHSDIFVILRLKWSSMRL